MMVAESGDTTGTNMAVASAGGPDEQKIADNNAVVVDNNIPETEPKTKEASVDRSAGDNDESSTITPENNEGSSDNGLDEKDAAAEADGEEDLNDEPVKTFPQKLMEMLSDERNQESITWLPHGKAFAIYKKKSFSEEVLPRYFKACKYTSFTRKLNRWGFTRMTRGPEMGSYFHPKFLRDDPKQCLQMCSNSGMNPAKFNPMMFPGAQGGFQNIFPMMPGGVPTMPMMGYFPGMMPFGMANPANATGAAGTPVDANSAALMMQQQMAMMQQMQQFQLQQMQQFQMQAAGAAPTAAGATPIAMPSSVAVNTGIPTAASTGVPAALAPAAQAPAAGNPSGAPQPAQVMWNPLSQQALQMQPQAPAQTQADPPGVSQAHQPAQAPATQQQGQHSPQMNSQGQPQQHIAQHSQSSPSMQGQSGPPHHQPVHHSQSTHHEQQHPGHSTQSQHHMQHQGHPHSQQDNHHQQQAHYGSQQQHHQVDQHQQEHVNHHQQQLQQTYHQSQQQPMYHHQTHHHHSQQQSSQYSSTSHNESGMHMLRQAASPQPLQTN